MDRKMKAYRFTEQTENEIKEIAQRLSISHTEAIARAVHYYYLSLDTEEEAIKSNKLVRFEDYQRIEEQLRKALYRLGELEGAIKEKEQLISRLDEEKERLYRLIESQQNQNRKRFWEFWK